jgi:hypothetical protein
MFVIMAMIEPVRFPSREHRNIVTRWLAGWSRKRIAATARGQPSRVHGILLRYCEQELAKGPWVDGRPSYFWRITRRLYPDAPIQATDPRAQRRRWSAEAQDDAQRTREAVLV